MFGLKKIADKALQDVIAMASQPHTTSASAEAVEDKRHEGSSTLRDIKNKAETKRDKAWLIWCAAGIANFFISLPIISIPLSFITLGAVGVTTYQFLKAREAKKCLREFEDEAKPYVREAFREYYDYDQQQRELERQAKVAKNLEAKKAAASMKVADVAPVGDGFNTVASDVDLDEDITVRRIKLKPREAAPAA